MINAAVCRFAVAAIALAAALTLPVAVHNVAVVRAGERPLAAGDGPLGAQPFDTGLPSGYYDGVQDWPARDYSVSPKMNPKGPPEENGGVAVVPGAPEGRVPGGAGA